MKKINFQELIIFENDDYLVVNKPPFVSTLDDRAKADKQNIISLAREYVETAQVAHRLDRETSGALAIAKNPEAYRHLSMQFQNREVKKIYHAIVNGIHKFENIEIDKPLKSSNTGVVRIDHQDGKDSRTFFQTLRAFQKHSLIECQPVTGRMHQIRVHLAFLKAPITGDELYGGKPIFLSEVKKKFHLKKHTEEQALMPRFALHAQKLCFNLLDGSPIEVEVPYSKDFRAAINQLEKHS